MTSNRLNGFFKRFGLSALAVALTALAAGAAQKVPITFDDYHGYPATAKYLKDVAAAYPQITALLEIGQSTMGRPIYVLVVSNMKTGTTVDALNRAAQSEVVSAKGTEFRLKGHETKKFCALVRMSGAEGSVEFTVRSKAGGTAARKITLKAE